MRMRTTLSWVALVVSGIALLIAAVGAILPLLGGSRSLHLCLFWRGPASSEGNDSLPAHLDFSTAPFCNAHL